MLVFTVSILFFISSTSEATYGTIAIAQLVPGIDPNVTGRFTFAQGKEGYVSGLSPGAHGFHIHDVGDVGNECLNAKGHFNPHQISHGAPHAEVRHVGDLGNIYANSEGVAYVQIFDKMISLDPKSSGFIGNRTLVVHKDEDDLGLGGNDGSLKTGNAGDRVACGLVAIMFVPEKPIHRK